MRKILLLVCFMSSLITVSQKITSIQNGNWSNTATWDAGVIPTKDNDVELAHEVIVDINLAEINNLIINSPSGDIKILKSESLTVNNNIVNNNFIRLTIADIGDAKTLILKYTYSGVGYTWAAYRPNARPYKLISSQLKGTGFNDYLTKVWDGK
jgi:aconitase B